MNILIVVQPGEGHFQPLLPLAQALRERGHAPAFATSASFCASVAAAGFPAFPVGVDWHQSAIEQTFPEFAALPYRRHPRFFMASIFCGPPAHAVAADIIALAATWPPALIVRDCWDYGSTIAAETLGVPIVTAGLGFFFAPERLVAVIGAQWSELRATFNLPADPTFQQLYRDLYLHYCPLSFAPLPAIPGATHAIRPPSTFVANQLPPPEWLEELPPRPTVYVSLGTVYNQVPALFEQIIAGLRDQPYNVVMTCGRQLEPAAFGDCGANVTVAQYIPQAQVLSRCDLSITHGGYNSVMAALTYGVPQIVIPFAADQPYNARRCAALGSGQILAPENVDAASIQATVERILAQPSYRTAAQAIKHEIAALPDDGYSVELIEGLCLIRERFR